VENIGLRTVKVLLPLPLSDAYDYSVPAGWRLLRPLCHVPLGKRETVGVVWGEGTATCAREKLREIADLLPAKPMADALRRFVDWVAAYTLAAGRGAAHGDGLVLGPRAAQTEFVYRPSAPADDAA
jgi:primosomal protein N' (replication factor Y)